MHLLGRCLAFCTALATAACGGGTNPTRTDAGSAMEAGLDATPMDAPAEAAVVVDSGVPVDLGTGADGFSTWVPGTAYPPLDQLVTGLHVNITLSYGGSTRVEEVVNARADGVSYFFHFADALGRYRYLSREGYGRWASSGNNDGLRQLAAAVQWLQQRRGRFMTSIYHGWLVEALAASGEVAGARRQAAALFARARQLDTFGMGDGCRALAMASATQGDQRRTARLMAYAERWATTRGSRREEALNVLCRARLARLHDPTGAQTLASAAAGLFESMHMGWHAEAARTWAPARLVVPTVQSSGGTTASTFSSMSAASAS